MVALWNLAFTSNHSKPYSFFSRRVVMHLRILSKQTKFLYHKRIVVRDGGMGYHFNKVCIDVGCSLNEWANLSRKCLKSTSWIWEPGNIFILTKILDASFQDVKFGWPYMTITARPFKDTAIFANEMLLFSVVQRWEDSSLPTKNRLFCLHFPPCFLSGISQDPGGAHNVLILSEYWR